MARRVRRRVDPLLLLLTLAARTTRPLPPPGPTERGSGSRGDVFVRYGARLPLQQVSDGDPRAGDRGGAAQRSPHVRHPDLADLSHEAVAVVLDQPHEARLAQPLKHLDDRLRVQALEAGDLRGANGAAGARAQPLQAADGLDGLLESLHGANPRPDSGPVKR